MSVNPMKGDIRVCDGCGVELRHMVDNIQPMKDGYYCLKCSKVWSIWDIQKKPIYEKHNQAAVEELKLIKETIFGVAKQSNVTGVEASKDSERVAKINQALKDLKDRDVKENI
jgi:hypothetical protein